MTMLIRGNEVERLEFIADRLDRTIEQFRGRDCRLLMGAAAESVAGYLEVLAEVARGVRSVKQTPVPEPQSLDAHRVSRRKLRVVT